MKQAIKIKNQTVSKKNIFKVLFFIFLALFLTISIILVVYLVKNNQRQPELTTKDEQTQIVQD
jgi:uncharacterized protein YpmS